MNTTFKSKKNTLLLLAAAILIPAMIPGCRKPVEDKEFRNSKEAIDVCRTNLYRLRNTPDADVKELASEINTWVNLKEKAVSVIMNEITTEYNGDSIDENTLEMALAPRREFTGIEDSTRSEITRLLSLPKWQLRDIVTIKQLTAKNQWQDLKEVEIRDAQDFYEKMDQIPAYQDLDLMLQTYDSLLSNTPAFEKEGQLYAFIREEDRCFRTLMDHLYEIPDETLQTLAEQTGGQPVQQHIRKHGQRCQQKGNAVPYHAVQPEDNPERNGVL